MTAVETVATRPQLRPGLRLLWRDSQALQLGLDPERAVVVEGLTEALARLVVGLDGTRTDAEVLTAAIDDELDPTDVTWLLAGLRRCAVVVAAEPVGLNALGGPDLAERLAPDHASLGLVHPEPAPVDTLLRRHGATVVVHGTGRVGAPLATLLAAAGVGRVHPVDADHARLADAAPGGLSPADGRAGRPRGQATANAIRRAAPETRTGPPPPGRPPDLVVLTRSDAAEPKVHAPLHRMRIPHLAVGVQGATAVVGPMVLPGLASCLRCADLHRRDRDPDWPALATQLLVPLKAGREPCDLGLASLAAALAAMQALALLDGGQPAAINGTLELTLPDWRVRRRTWPPHPLCGCGAAHPHNPEGASDDESE